MRPAGARQDTWAALSEAGILGGYTNGTLLIQSRCRWAAVPDKLPGNGHLPSIGARFPAPKCPVLPGETVPETVPLALVSLDPRRPGL
jgi:hypothetical protein